MNIHEYQAKEIFKQFGVPAGTGQVARSADEAVQAAKALGGERWVVKAQVHAGGRGKAGGVKICDNADEVRTVAADMLGSTLTTQQTAGQGLPIDRKSTRLNSSHVSISYAVFCLKKKKQHDGAIAEA